MFAVKAARAPSTSAPMPSPVDASAITATNSAVPAAPATC